MPEFNPNNPAISGMEWYGCRRIPLPLKLGAGTGFVLASTASETLTSITPWLQSPNNALVGLDVYDNSSVVAALVGGIDVPGVDIASSAGFEATSDNGATWGAYSTGIGFVDRAISDDMTPAAIRFVIEGTGTWLRYNPVGSQAQGHLTWQGTGAYVNVTDDTPGGDPSSSRVGVIVVNIAARKVGTGGTIDGLIDINGTNYGSERGAQPVTSAWKRYSFYFYWNPATARQWNNADIAQFLSGGTNAFGIACRGKSPTDIEIGAVNIVWYSCAEQRLTTGYGNAPGDGFSTNGMQLLDTAAGTPAPWSKSTSTDYLMVFYLAGRSPGIAYLNAIDAASLAEDSSQALGGWTGAMQPTFSTSAIPSAVGTLGTYAPTVLLVQAGPVESVDSQPYAVPSIASVPSTATNSDVSEFFGNHSTANYAMIRVVVAMFDFRGTPIAPDAPLVIGVHDTSDVLIGGTFTIQPEDVPTDGRCHLVAGRLSAAAALSSASNYYIGFTTTSTVPWSVVWLDVVDSAAAGAAINNGGFVNGLGVFGDLLTNVGTVPAVLTGLTSVVTTAAQSPAPGCGPVDVQYVQLGWNASVLGADFGYYEVQRASDGGSFFTIARITSEASNAYTDRECLRNLPEEYRIRVVRADGAQSDWTTGSPVTATTTLGADLIVATGTEIFAYGESGNSAPMHNFARANAQSMVTHLIAGRTPPVAFRPQTEGNSDVFQRTLIVNVDTPGSNLAATDPGGLDRFPFDPLIALIEDTTQPYVTLCDGHGRRWFCFAEFVQGSYAPIGHAHLCDVKFTEVAVIPIPHVTT